MAVGFLSTRIMGKRSLNENFFGLHVLDTGDYSEGYKAPILCRKMLVFKQYGRKFPFITLDLIFVCNVICLGHTNIGLSVHTCNHVS